MARLRTTLGREAKRVDAIARDFERYEKGDPLPAGRMRRLQRYLVKTETRSAWDDLVGKHFDARRKVLGRAA